MVPGVTEREARATEMRRRDLLAEVERERLLRTHAADAPRLPRDRWRRSIGGALVSVGRRLQGAERASAGGPAPVIEPAGTGR